MRRSRTSRPIHPACRDDPPSTPTSFATQKCESRGLGVDSRYIYWSNEYGSTIGRANLNGTGVNQRFITAANRPDALVIDSRYVYWANWGNGTIGRASLDGTGVNQSFLAVRRGRPVGVAVLPGP
jgi:hypothetical protein